MIEGPALSWVSGGAVVVIGGAHITIALVALAKTLGYRTVVIDPRKAFGNEARFPPGSVDRLVQAWPDEALAEIPLRFGDALLLQGRRSKINLLRDEPGLLVLEDHIRGCVVNAHDGEAMVTELTDAIERFTKSVG